MKKHKEIFAKYSWNDPEQDSQSGEIFEDILEKIKEDYDLEAAEANYGIEDGGWFWLILQIAEGMTEDQHKELAEYFASSVKEVKW